MDKVKRELKAAGYTFNKNKMVGDFGTSGQPLQSQQPKHLFKLFTTYTFVEGARLAGLEASIGVNAQTKTFEAGTACSRFIGVFNPFSGQTQVSCDFTSFFPYQFTQKGYVLVSARLGYRINPQLRVGLNVNNLTNHRYYQTVGSSTSGNFYGAPRNFMLTLLGTFGKKYTPEDHDHADDPSLQPSHSR